MRDFSCFRDAAVSTISAASSGAGDHLDRSLQAATACVYRAALTSSRKEILITVTWTRSLSTSPTDAAPATGLSVALEDVAPTKPKLPPPSSAVGTTAATPRRSPLTPASQKMHLQTKRRGSRSFVTEGGTAVAVHWDTSNAKYATAATTTSSSSPEPSGDYYLAVVAEGEPVLLLGDAARRFATAAPPRPQAVLLSRREQLRAAPSPSTPLSVSSVVVAHSTRCRFRDGGAEHEVTVHCRGDRRTCSSAATDEGEVAVSVDGRTLVEARRVGWNFRGNRTAVLADGAVVEVMWDVHDWWFSGCTGTGAAQFMVKARGDGSGVWMDEELASKGHPPAGFFLHMQCYRR